MKKGQKLFRTKWFGGYQKLDVDRYIRRLEEELSARERELEGRAEKEKEHQALIDEAIGELQRLREENALLWEENEQLRGEAAPAPDLRKERRDRYRRLRR